MSKRQVSGLYGIFFGMSATIPNCRRGIPVNARILGGCSTILLYVVLAAACADAKIPYSGGDTDIDADTDADTDTDTDADTDSDTDSDAECTVDELEPFDLSGLPAGWEIEDFDDDAYGYAWEWSESDNTTGGAGGHWWINGAFPVEFDDRLTSATYTRGECPEVRLSFNQDFAKDSGDDFGYVQIQVDEGTWQTLATLSASASGGWDTDISSYLTDADAEFRIRFRYVGNNNLHWKVDDFELSGGNP